MWREHESFCGGEHQSPINIDSSKTVIKNYPKFCFHNYDLVFPERLENNGHTGIVSPHPYLFYSFTIVLDALFQWNWKSRNKVCTRNCLLLPAVDSPTAIILYNSTFIGAKVYLAANILSIGKSMSTCWCYCNSSEFLKFLFFKDMLANCTSSTTTPNTEILSMLSLTRTDWLYWEFW